MNFISTYKYISLFTFSLFYFAFSSTAQNVSINTTGATPVNSAMLDVSDTASGILIPRMTMSQRLAIISPANGLLVFQINNEKGIYSYITSNGAWSKITDEADLKLDKILSGGNSAAGDTAYNFGALSVGIDRLPKSSLEIDSFLTIQGKPYQGFRWYGFNTYVDASDKLRYLNTGGAGILGFGGDKTLIGHWEEGTKGGLVPDDASSSISLDNYGVLVDGEDSDFSIELRGITIVDSLIVNNNYSFPNVDGILGEVLTSNGAGEVIWNTPLSDNLGNHTASENIILNGYYLSNDGDNEGLHVAANGNVTIGNNTGFDQFAVWNSTTDAKIAILSEVASTTLQMLARGTNETNNITAFRSRGTSATQTSVQANDDIFTINVQPFYNGSSSILKSLNISIDAVDGVRASTKIGLFTRAIGGSNVERFTIRDDGRIGIGTTSPSALLDVVGDIEIPAANSYTYSTAKTHYQSYAPTTFRALIPRDYSFGTDNAADFSTYFTSGGSAFGYATVIVNLPDGAIVSELEGWILDNSASSPVRVTLYRQALGSSTVSIMAQIESDVVTSSAVVQNLTDLTINSATIYNEIYAYYLMFTGRQNSVDTKLYGAKLSYTVTETD